MSNFTRIKKPTKTRKGDQYRRIIKTEVVEYGPRQSDRRKRQLHATKGWRGYRL